MRRQDYRYVDVSGIAIADKILPKMDDAAGSWRPNRAEDVAFLYESVAERGDTIGTPSLYPNERFGPGSRSGTLIWHVRNVSRTTRYCDMTAVGTLADKEATGTADLETQYPALFPTLATPLSDFGRVDKGDDLRRMYYDLKRHEAMISGGIYVSGTRSETDSMGGGYNEPYSNQSLKDMRLYEVSRDDNHGPVDAQFTFWRNDHSSITIENEEPGSAFDEAHPAALVMFIDVKGAWDGTTTEKTFARVFTTIQPSQIGADLGVSCIQAAGLDPGSGDGHYGYNRAKVAACFALLPFEGNTKLRNINWNWSPS